MITYGADPEYLLINIDQQAVAACGLFDGTKQDHIPLIEPHDDWGFAAHRHVDNVALEVTMDPADDPQDMVYRANQCYEALYNVVCTTYPDLAISRSCAARFRQQDLQHPLAREFGCAPDLDAYKNGMRAPAVDRDRLIDGDSEWRFAGGHIHIGYKNTAPQLPAFVAALLCDALLLLPLVADGFIQADPAASKRLEYYGSPGRYRETEYGIEYRSLPNMWTFSTRYPSYQATVAGGLVTLHDKLNGSLSALRDLYEYIPWFELKRAIVSQEIHRAARLRALIAGYIGRQ